MGEFGIQPYYEKRYPSAQNVADIFKDSWKSALPGEIASGEAPMFKDVRPRWAASHIPGGFGGKSVLELGPFEAYQTYLMLCEGAQEIVSIEANSINFLKCLCVKEIFGLTAARFQLGDIVKYVRGCDRKFDIAWASGVLYHLQDPIQLIEYISRIAQYVYVWTHYFDDEVMANLKNGQERHFIPQLDQTRKDAGRDLILHARSYLLPDYQNGLPIFWEGGLEQITYWLSKDDIFWLFDRAGMRVMSIESVDTNVNGLPAIGFLVTRGS